MNRTLTKIAWLILPLAPILFWIEIYRAWTTEYDENWAHFFSAIFISFLTIVLLIFTKIEHNAFIRLKIIFKASILLISSPLTVGAIILYLMIFPMQWKWSSSHVNNGKSYSDIKKRNYFKAENYLILDNLTSNPDTIMAVINRNGKIEKLIRLKGGQEIHLNKSILDSLSEKQRKNLTEY